MAEQKIHLGKFINNLDSEDLSSEKLQGVVNNVYAKAISTHKKKAKEVEEETKEQEEDTVTFIKSNHDRLKAHKNKPEKDIDKDDATTKDKVAKDLNESLDDEFEVARYNGNKYGIWSKTSKNWMTFGRKKDLEKRVKELNDNNPNKKLKEAEEGITPDNIYDALIKKLPAEDIDHHESDLYVRKTPKSTEIINKLTNKSLLSTFKDNIDGDIWYELPFCYTPFFGESKELTETVKSNLFQPSVDPWERDTIDTSAWVKGTISKDGAEYQVSAKVFNEPSQYGINHGRISKLWVKEKGYPVAINYDRGWVDAPPHNEDLLNTVIKELEDYRDKHPISVNESKQIPESKKLTETSVPRNASKIKVGGREFTKNDKYWSYDDKDSLTGKVNVSPKDIKRLYGNDVEVLETDPNYKPKRTKEVKVLQGNYGYGWDDLVEYDKEDSAEVKQDLRSYRENERNAQFRVVTRRVPLGEDKLIEDAYDDYFGDKGVDYLIGLVKDIAKKGDLKKYNLTQSEFYEVWEALKELKRNRSYDTVVDGVANFIGENSNLLLYPTKNGTHIEVNNMYESKKVEGKKLTEAKSAKKFIYNLDGRFVAHQLIGVDSKFNRPFDLAKKYRDITNDPSFKKGSIGAKHKSYRNAVNEWVKTVEPTEFIVYTKEESPSWKDDSLDVYYKKESIHESKTPYGDTTIEDYVNANFSGSQEDKNKLIAKMREKANGSNYFNGLNMSVKDWEKAGKEFGLTMKRHPVTESKKLTEAEDGNMTIETSTSILDMFYPSLYQTIDDYYIPDNEWGRVDDILANTSMEFAEEAIRQVFPKATVKFKELRHPREYNYGGENIIFDVTLPRADYESVKQKVAEDPNFAEFLKKNSPRSGYIPFGAYTVDKFKTQDDMYSIGQIVKFLVDEEDMAYDFDEKFREEISSNYDTYDILWEEVMDWLREHDQAYQDFLTHFHADENSVIDLDSIIGWISDHDTLAQDFENRFGFSLGESLKEAFSTDNELNEAFKLDELQLNKFVRLVEVGKITKDEFLDAVGRLIDENSSDLKQLLRKPDENVKKWYKENYPTDPLGDNINPNLTFGELIKGINKHKDFYDLIGVGDSLVRERLFNWIAKICGVSYDTVYNKWLGESVKTKDTPHKKLMEESEGGPSLSGFKSEELDDIFKVGAKFTLKKPMELEVFIPDDWRYDWSEDGFTDKELEEIGRDFRQELEDLEQYDTKILDKYIVLDKLEGAKLELPAGFELTVAENIPNTQWFNGNPWFTEVVFDTKDGQIRQFYNSVPGPTFIAHNS